MKVSSCSYSSDRKLRRCEMQFHYRYEEKLKAKAKKTGLLRGDWGHRLLEAYYRGPFPYVDAPVKRRIRVKENKVVTWQDALAQIKEKEWDVLFDEEKEMYGEDFLTNIEKLMTHYCEYWFEWDKQWEVISIEQDFEQMTKFGFPVRWKSDLIVREKSGGIALVETKFKKDIPDAEERLLNQQPHGYAWLLSKFAGIKIDRIIWNYIRTKPVPRPKILKNGDLSTRQLNTDQRSYLVSLAEAGISPETPSEWEAIQSKLTSLPDTLSLERITNSVNLKIGEKHVRDWIERHRRALDIKRPLTNYVRDCRWDCDYYNLCQADMRGDVDRDLIIKRDFVINKKPETGEELK